MVKRHGSPRSRGFPAAFAIACLLVAIPVGNARADDGFRTGLCAGAAIAWTREGDYDALPGSWTRTGVEWLFGFPGILSVRAATGFEFWSPTAFGDEGYLYRGHHAFAVSAGALFRLPAFPRDNRFSLSASLDAAGFVAGRYESDYLYLGWSVSAGPELALRTDGGGELAFSLPVSFHRFADTSSVGAGLGASWRFVFPKPGFDSASEGIAR